MRVASDVSPVSPFCFTATLMHSPTLVVCLLGFCGRLYCLLVWLVCFASASEFLISSYAVVLDDRQCLTARLRAKKNDAVA